MPPQQPFQPTQQPQGPQRPSSPPVPMPGHEFQQHQNGQYEVVPPLPSAQNAGHSGHNPYDFIMAPSAQNAGHSGFMGGNFPKQISVLLGGVVVLLIIGGILISALAPKGSTPDMISIAQRQQELIRVSTAATRQATSQDAKDFVANVDAVTASDQKQLLAYLQANGTKLSTKLLSLDQSSQTDSELANAASANNYDSAVTSNLTEQLQTYESLVQSTYKLAGKNGKALLRTDFNNTALLLQQAKQVSAKLQ